MTSLSIGKAWEETAAFVKREGALLFPVAFVFLALPMGLAQLFAPQVDPNMPPQQMMEAFRPFWLAMGPALMVTMYGGLALLALSLKPGISVGEALAVALRRYPVALGVMLIMTVGAGLLVLVLAMVAALGGGNERTAAGLMLILLLPLSGLMIWAGMRLMLVQPTIIDAPVGPIAAIKASWAMSRGHFWRLLAFVVVFGIVIGIGQMAASAVFGSLAGLVAGADAARFAGDGAGIIISTFANVYLLVMIARIYTQLADQR